MVLITLGTGIGTVVFTKGKILPNTEFGHIQLKGDIAEKYASDAARKRDGLKWDEWAARFNEYLGLIENLLIKDNNHL